MIMMKRDVCVCVYVCVCVCVFSHSVISDSLESHGLCSLPSSSVQGIIPEKILDLVAIPSPGDLPDPMVEPMSLASPALAGGLFTTEPPRKPLQLEYKQ